MQLELEPDGQPIPEDFSVPSGLDDAATDLVTPETFTAFAFFDPGFAFFPSLVMIIISFVGFVIHALLLGWDEKWFYMEQRFVQDEKAAAIGIVQALFRARDGNVSPGFRATMSQKPAFRASSVAIASALTALADSVATTVRSGSGRMCMGWTTVTVTVTVSPWSAVVPAPGTWLTTTPSWSGSATGWAFRKSAMR